MFLEGDDFCKSKQQVVVSSKVSIGFQGVSILIVSANLTNGKSNAATSSIGARTSTSRTMRRPKDVDSSTIVVKRL